MNEKVTSNHRRQLLKAASVGGGTYITVQSLPKSWTKPLVNSVVLPAHAQSSPPQPKPTELPTTTVAPPVVSCLGDQFSLGSGAIERIELLFDGDLTCSIGDVVSGGQSMVTIRRVQDSDSVVSLGNGSDWVHQSGSIHVAPGTYTYNVVRAVAPNQGKTFAATITISASGSGSSFEITVTVDNLVALP